MSDYTGLTVEFGEAVIPTKRGGVLGCGTNRAFLQRRGGGGGLTELPHTALGYGRRLDDISSGSVSIGVEGFASQSCCQALAGVNAWEHEVAVWRNDDEAWVGPVVTPDLGEDDATLACRDLFTWFERRSLPFDRVLDDVDLALIFLQYLTDALSRDQSPAISFVPQPTGIVGTRAVLAASKVRAADELRELARSGVDFTMIGRNLLVGGEEVLTPAIGPLTTGDLIKPRLRSEGLSAATEVTVNGSLPLVGDAPVQGTAGGVDVVFGLLEAVYSESSIRDAISAQAAAQTRLDMLRSPPEYLTAGLSPDAPIAFADLVPGARVSVAAVVGCREVIGDFRLSSVDVTDEGAGSEDVSVQLIPIGTEV